VVDFPFMTGTRIDKWLWAARFYKTRSMAAKACELGRVESHGQPVKPAREVRAGDMLTVETAGGKYEVEVTGLSEVRGSAAVAQTLYRETEESKVARQKEAEQRRLNRAFTPAPPTRPSKRDRRRIIRFRGE
jgi:ribosome-associated heat shock protein Hsp15